MLFILSGISTPLPVTRSTAADAAKGNVTCVKMITFICQITEEFKILKPTNMNYYDKFTILMSYQLFILDILNTKKNIIYFF